MLSNILRDRTSTLKWLKDIGLIPTSIFCKTHKKQMTLQESKSICGIFVCQKKGHYSHNVTVAKDTWFERTHISAEMCILLTYCFAMDYSYEQTKRECSLIPGQSISSETIADRFSYCRELCILSLDESFENEGKIGGQGEIIEIDECKIGRRKFEKGRVVEGSWILGIIHRGHPENYRIEICPHNQRDEKTLLALIKKHVKEGSEIHTDCWRGYFNLNMHGYVHKTVNHSQNFVDPSTGAYTQNIESSWRHLRRTLNNGIHKEHMADHLCEYLWRRRIQKLNIDPFSQLLRDIKNCYPGHNN